MKKAVEGLPLKYVIIALIAVLVIAIALEMVGILKTGIISSVTQINQSLANKTTEALNMT